jgi:CubicO group peptidase (beta-lactamase class C family)
MSAHERLEIHGFVAPGYERVRAAFEANFHQQQEVGAAVSAWADGRPIVSLWGGLADQVTGRAWVEDTLVLVFSMTKALTATCVHQLAERGQLDLDAPVAHYWPQFAVRGKDEITVRMVMAHRAGLPLVEAQLTLAEALAWEPVVESLAAQAPLWEPGTQHGYHFRTYGWLLGEIFRRVSGRSVGQYFAQELAKPVGLDWFLGLPPAHDARVARLVPPPPNYHALIASLPKDLLLVRAMSTPSNLFHYSDMWNDLHLLRSELPSSNSVTNAAAAARFYASLLGQLPEQPILRHETLRSACSVVSQGVDCVLMTPTVFGSGYQLAKTLPSAVSADAFGHAGAGGSVGFADPSAGLAFAYTPNRLRFDTVPDPRSEALVSALYAAHALVGVHAGAGAAVANRPRG